MNRKNRILLLFLALFALAFTQKHTYQVKNVYDGDTILLEGEKRVRYLGIDAPEIGRNGTKSQPLALASRAMNRRIVGNTRVTLELDREKWDRHGRLLAYVFLEGGTMVNALLSLRLAP